MLNSMREQLMIIAEAETVLRELGVLRSRNLVGDVAEWIACRELGLVRERANRAGYDATDAEGQRVQIKGVRLPNRQPGSLQKFEQRPFARLVVVVLAEDLQKHEIIDLTLAEVEEQATWSKSNGWQLRRV